jgi:peptidoglycan/LPS O-acetylase OafA/YrhL
MRYPLLDPLRGLAAVWVFTHHLVYSTGNPVPSEYRLACVGYLGVPLFFIVSGYCLTAAARRSARCGDPVPRFLLRRAIRIYPPFWGAVVVALAVYAVLATIGGHPQTPLEAHLRAAWQGIDLREWGGMLTLGSAFRSTGELPWEKFSAVNLAFWTLAIEVQFYAVVGLALLAPRRFYGLLAVVTVASLPLMFNEAAYRSGWFLPHWPFFALGIALYAALERGWTAGRVPWAARLVVSAVAVVLLVDGVARSPLIPHGTRGMVAAAFEFAAGAVGLLWVWWRPAGERGRAPGLAVAGLTYLGSVSYTLYLLHIPLMVGVTALIGSWLPPGTIGYFALTLAGVCLLCYPFHRWVERPCMGGSERRGAAKPAAVPAVPGYAPAFP